MPTCRSATETYDFRGQEQCRDGISPQTFLTVINFRINVSRDGAGQRLPLVIRMTGSSPIQTVGALRSDHHENQDVPLSCEFLADTH